MKILAVIPVRQASSRLPGKALIPILDKPLIQHVYEGVVQSKIVQKVMVATDSKKIFSTVRAFGGQAQMTSRSHPTGTDRVCEVAEKEDWADIILNIQGDEPLVSKSMVEALVRPFKTHGQEVAMTTLKRRLTSPKEIQNPHAVKVLTDLKGKALYFSRNPLPFDREGCHPKYYLHIGLYGYSRDFLSRYAQLKRTPAEIAESLEQLRVLEHGYSIFVNEIKEKTIDVNVKEDLKKAEILLQKKK